MRVDDIKKESGKEEAYRVYLELDFLRDKRYNIF